MLRASEFAHGFGLVLTGALLASCGRQSIAPQLPATSVTQTLPRSATTSYIDPGASLSIQDLEAVRARADVGGSETLNGPIRYHHCQNYNFSFDALGTAEGPYPGPFTLGGNYHVGSGSCDQEVGGTTDLSEGFSVTLRTGRTLMGNLSGTVTYVCYPTDFGLCLAQGTVGYTAGLYAGSKLLKKFSGTASIDEDLVKTYVYETLENL